MAYEREINKKRIIQFSLDRNTLRLIPVPLAYVVRGKVNQGDTFPGLSSHRNTELELHLSNHLRCQSSSAVKMSFFVSQHNMGPKTEQRVSPSGCR